MTTTAPIVDTFTITDEILVRASMANTFDSIITQLGEDNETPDGKSMQMLLEPRPGGRWYRDLGDGNGHLWAFIQSIKRPALLELWGPLFMSSGAMSNLMYRLTEKDGGTLISFRHSVVGPFPEEQRAPTFSGWEEIHARVKRVAESAGGRS
ncbi:MAG: SRPBCC domain-containing protein [Gemmatimonadaceae bacterium]|nr:SRPBCC domain-containing protein [Gemmatimonadaceae bacterium]